ncbi:MAG: acyl-CoA dehydrogenase family protein [bacterium]
MAKKTYFLDEDIQFHFKNTITWEKIVPLFENLDGNFSLKQAVNMYHDTLKELGAIASNELEETARESDEIGIRCENGDVIYTEGFKKALAAFKQSEALALNVRPEYEGPGMPGLIHMINMEMICRADAAFMTVYAFYSGVAKTLEVFASEDLKRQYIPKLVKGEYGGSMSLTESDAGSDLGQVRTIAENKGDHWEITGTKTFITNGNGEVTLVLARSDRKSSGTKGLSMYVVPRYIQKNGGKISNFSLGTAEHKLGIHASPTLELLFDKSIGYLVGEEGQGLKQMFYLMNEARLGVSAQALGIAQKALEEAREYAAERVQFGKPIAQHELVADKLLDMETDVKAMRSLLYKGCEYEDIRAGLEERLKGFQGDPQERARLEREFKRYKYLAREMVPIVKYFVTEKSIQITRDNIQIHGGNGYTTDYLAELHLRDSIITTIYEGTSQIQALMAMGDTLKKSRIIPYLEPIRNRIKGIKGIFSSRLHRKAIKAEIYFNSAVDYLRRPFVLAGLFKNKKRQKAALSYAMLYAERLTRLKAYSMIIHLLVQEAKRFPERKPLAERFIRNYLPEMKKESRFIKSGDRTTLASLNGNGVRS